MGIKIGSMAGKFQVADDFDAPLSDDELRDLAHVLPPPTSWTKAEDLPDVDVANYLDGEEQIEAYLAAAAAENDPELLAKALDDVARARKRLGLPS